MNNNQELEKERLPEEGTDTAEGYEPGTQLDSVFRFLETDTGKEITQKLFGELAEYRKLLKDLNDASGNRKKKATNYGYLIVFVIIVSASLLHWIGRFDGAISILYGGIIGYLFGRQKSA